MLLRRALSGAVSGEGDGIALYSLQLPHSVTLKEELVQGGTVAFGESSGCWDLLLPK
jgi:hypothetical protein